MGLNVRTLHSHVAFIRKQREELQKVSEEETKTKDYPKVDDTPAENTKNTVLPSLSTTEFIKAQIELNTKVPTRNGVADADGTNDSVPVDGADEKDETQITEEQLQEILDLLEGGSPLAFNKLKKLGIPFEQVKVEGTNGSYLIKFSVNGKDYEIPYSEYAANKDVITNEVYENEYSEAALKENRGFSDKDLSYYFSKVDHGNGTVGYVMRDDIYFNDAGTKKINTLDELQAALDAGKRTYCPQAQSSLEGLNKIGFTNEQIALYFYSMANSLSGEVSYSVKSGLLAKSENETREIKTPQQLFDAIKSGAVITDSKGNTPELPPQRDELNKMGFSDEQINKYFDKNTHGELSVETFSLGAWKVETSEGKSKRIETPEELLDALNNGYNVSEITIEDINRWTREAIDNAMKQSFTFFSK